MSHHYYYHAAKTIGGGMKNVPEDTLYTCLPLFHVNAQVCTVVSALVFDCRVSMYEHFSASTFWSEIRNSGATVFLASEQWVIFFTKRRHIRTTIETTCDWRWWCLLLKISKGLKKGMACE